MDVYGLIGKELGHSFSPTYFTKKFKKEGIENSVYQLFPLGEIEHFPDLLQREKKIKGLNVTIPYKTAIIPFLDDLSEQAKAIGAVNTIQIKNGQLIGHNTDVVGFKMSLEKNLSVIHKKTSALVLGTGGASKAVVFALKELGISCQYVSRKTSNGVLTYDSLSEEIIKENLILINTTPLGMSPNLKTCPVLPYGSLTENHLLFDLVYNPMQTLFMQKGIEKGGKAINGLEMLHLQAEAAWAIWQKK